MSLLTYFFRYSQGIFSPSVYRSKPQISCQMPSRDLLNQSQGFAFMVDSKKAQSIQSQIYLRVYHYGSLYNSNIHFWKIFDHLFYVQCKQKCADRMKPRINALETHISSHPKAFLLSHQLLWHFLIVFSFWFFIYMILQNFRLCSGIPGVEQTNILGIDLSLIEFIGLHIPQMHRVQLHLITIELFNAAFSWTDDLLPRDIVTYRTGIRIH